MRSRQVEPQRPWISLDVRLRRRRSCNLNRVRARRRDRERVRSWAKHGSRRAQFGKCRRRVYVVYRRGMLTIAAQQHPEFGLAEAGSVLQNRVENRLKSPGELEMTLAPRAVAVCCSSASSRSRLDGRAAPAAQRLTMRRAATRITTALGFAPPGFTRLAASCGTPLHYGPPPRSVGRILSVQASTLVGAGADVAMDCRLNRSTYTGVHVGPPIPIGLSAAF